MVKNINKPMFVRGGEYKLIKTTKIKKWSTTKIGLVKTKLLSL